MVNVTSRGRVKTLLGLTGTTEDDFIDTLVSGVSAEIAKYIGRPISEESRTEQYTVLTNGRQIFLRATPILTVTSIIVDPFWQFTGTAVASTRYNIETDTGAVYFMDAIVGGFRVSGYESSVKNAIQVIYTGGLGASAGDVISNHPNIALAADIQIGEDFRRRNNPDTKQRGGPSGGRSWTDAHRFLPRVQQMLATEVRYILGSR